MDNNENSSSNNNSEDVRFEDLTVDDDLPILERIVRYSQSHVALQRLVHVKMLAEASILAGYVWNEKGAVF
jgi:serine/threonine-protein phosphatase 4 regulatory subunit 1